MTTSVKGFFRKNRMRVSAEVYETLNTKISELLLKAMERAKKNGRTTLMEQDLWGV